MLINKNLPADTKEFNAAESVQSAKVTAGTVDSQFKEGVVYHWKDLGNPPTLLYIKTNRKRPEDIKKKLASCKKFGLIVPAIFTDPRIAVNAGYTLVDEEGKLITDFDNHILVLDGNTRCHAWAEEVSTDKPFALKFIYMRFEKADTFKDTYHEVNSQVIPINTEDRVREACGTSDNIGVKMYCELITQEKLVNKAAGYYVFGKEIGKREVETYFTVGDGNDKNPLKVTKVVQSRIRNLNP